MAEVLHRKMELNINFPSREIGLDSLPGMNLHCYDIFHKNVMA